MRGNREIPCVFRFGAFEADLKAGELRKDGIRIKLQEQPFKILTLLLQHPGDVVTREEIQKALWGSDTFVDFDRALNKAINRLREALGDSAENSQYVETLPKRGYRFIAAVAPVIDDIGVTSEPDSPPRKFRAWLTAAVLIIAASATALVVYLRHPLVLTEQDTVVLADFANRTSDPAFEYTLKLALSIDLQQSPFLKILPDQQVADTLHLMLRNSDERLSVNLARSVCKRTGSAAVLAGSIASFGTEYVIGLEATDCQAGNVLAQEQVRANRKEDILARIDQAAAKLRRKLGESLPSIEKYDRPIHEALSTASLEAFQAYANGERTVRREGSYGAISFFKRAIELDPEFAYAYAALGLIYGTAGEENLSAEYTKKAYELQAHVSEWEKYFISIQYCLQATGDLDKGLQVGRMWVQNYPRERTAHNRLAEIYERLGNPADAAAELEQARVLGGDNPLDLTRLSRAYMAVDRWSDARAILLEAIRRSPQRPTFRQAIYSLAFLQDDQKLLQEQVDWAMHKPEELAFLGTADTEAYFGRLAKARELSRLAEDYASRTDFKERAALLHAGEALREALFGNTEAAREQSRVALDAGPGPGAQVLATLALAQTGDVVRAGELADELRHKFPFSTLVQNYWIPAIRAQIELASNNPAKAIELLRNTEPYELSSEGPMIPVYVRALAYLGAQQGAAAAAEFQKILQHRGIVGNSVVGALAHLGLAEALSVARDNLEARAKYEQFLNLWKHADPGTPIRREAKSRFGL